MTDLNYWTYNIYRNSFRGKTRLVAVYVAATHSSSVDMDIGSGDSYLEDFLRRFFRIDPRDYVKNYPLRAESLLGALHAKRHCALRFGILSDLTPPTARRIDHFGQLGDPDHEENGVKLWLREEGETIQEA
jgi:hypothetical protein